MAWAENKIQDCGHAFYIGKCAVRFETPTDLDTMNTFVGSVVWDDIWKWFKAEYPHLYAWSETVPADNFELTYASHVSGQHYWTVRVYVLIKGPEAVEFKLKWAGDEACEGSFNG